VAALLQILLAVFDLVVVGHHLSTLFTSSLGLLVVALVALSWGAGPSLFAVFVGLAVGVTCQLSAIGVGEPVMLEHALQAALCLSAAIGISVAAGSNERSRRQAVEERTKAHARELASREVQARMDEFLAIASHDLRSPLAATTGYLDLSTLRYDRLTSLLNATHPDLAPQFAAVRACLDDSGKSMGRLSGLVELLFDTAQARAGTLALHRAPCDLGGLVREQVAALCLAHPQRTLYLDMPDERSVSVTVDAVRIGQVVTNFVTNALKYSPADQPVAVSLTLEGGSARVSVKDRGPGLPPRERERIWQRFYRAEGIGVQSGSSTGLGLGLYICQALIEGHDGRVGVESEVGKGSTFWFELPLASSSLVAEKQCSVAS
jgi:signal transduction histidine kinase